MKFTKLSKLAVVLLLCSSSLFLFNSCAQDEVVENALVEEVDFMSREQLNQEIFSILEETEGFSWNDLTDEQLASAFLLAEDKIITVAWDEASVADVEKEVIIDFILSAEVEAAEQVILEENDKLNLLHARVADVNTVLGLRQLEEVVALDVYYEIFTEEEVENAAQQFKVFLSENYNASAEERGATRTPFSADAATNHNIPEAWNAGLTGDNLTVAVIDGGLQSGDPVFGSSGSGGNPARSLDKVSRYKWAWWNPFAGYESVYESGLVLSPGHGTSMIKIIGGPSGAGTTGAAYNANLVSVRSSNFVWIDLLENVIGVTRAFEYLADRPDVRVISMSQGGLVEWISIERAVDDAYDNGKMIFTAGGTFPAAIIIGSLIAGSPGNITLFPARESNVYSCTGIGTTSNIDWAYWCFNCFGKADFVVEFDSGGSSSEATANTAGMAALIWARQPYLTRSQVYFKMMLASDRTFFKHPDFGHGRLKMQRYIDNEGL